MIDYLMTGVELAASTSASARWKFVSSSPVRYTMPWWVALFWCFILVYSENEINTEYHWKAEMELKRDGIARFKNVWNFVLLLLQMNAIIKWNKLGSDRTIYHIPIDASKNTTYINSAMNFSLWFEFSHKVILIEMPVVKKHVSNVVPRKCQMIAGNMNHSFS